MINGDGKVGDTSTPLERGVNKVHHNYRQRVYSMSAGYKATEMLAGQRHHGGSKYIVTDGSDVAPDSDG
jgi:hypothetical protein